MQITGKDLNYLSDEMSWQLLAMKRCHHYSQHVQNPQLKQAIDQVGQMHQRHFEELLSLLQSGSNPTMTTGITQ